MENVSFILWKKIPYRLFGQPNISASDSIFPCLSEGSIFTFPFYLAPSWSPKKSLSTGP